MDAWLTILVLRTEILLRLAEFNARLEAQCMAHEAEMRSDRKRHLDAQLAFWLAEAERQGVKP
jgi:hypothetical protein